MADPALHAFLEVLRRELGADDAYLQLGGKATDGDRQFFQAVGEDTHAVVVFVDPPADAASVHDRLGVLCTTFQKTIDAAASGAARPRHTIDLAHRKLDEELTFLSERAGAVRAFVFDLESPVVWGESSVEQDVPAATTLLEAAVVELRERAEELKQAQNHTLRLTLADGVESLVRPFAGIYVLSLLFRDPLSEPIALGAIVHAVGVIEKLVLALPPIDPEPGAKVIRLRSPRSGD